MWCLKVSNCSKDGEKDGKKIREGKAPKYSFEKRLHGEPRFFSFWGDENALIRELRCREITS